MVGFPRLLLSEKTRFRLTASFFFRSVLSLLYTDDKIKMSTGKNASDDLRSEFNRLDGVRLINIIEMPLQ